MEITYRCTRNIKTIINAHNAKILFPKKSTEQRACNCLSKDNFPLEQKCITTNIVYKAKVTSSNGNYQEKIYFSSYETTFKKRFWNHKKSFNLNEYKNETELSNEVWQIKDSGHQPKVNDLYIYPVVISSFSPVVTFVYIIWLPLFCQLLPLLLYCLIFGFSYRLWFIL